MSVFVFSDIPGKGWTLQTDPADWDPRLRGLLELLAASPIVRVCYKEKTIRWEEEGGNSCEPDGGEPSDAEGKGFNDDEIEASCKEHDAWSQDIEARFGKKGAALFAKGYDFVLEEVRRELRELADCPKGTHVGQMAQSWLAGMLPEQFLMEYDYQFVSEFVHAIEAFGRRVKCGCPVVAHTVAEELIVHLIECEAEAYLDLIEADFSLQDVFGEGLLGEICDDSDVVTWLYSGLFWPVPGDSYYFDRWFEPQFYLDEREE